MAADFSKVNTRLLSTLGLPKRLQLASLEGVQNEDAKTFLENYFRHGKKMFKNGEGIFIVGEPLTGKSCLAAVLMKFFTLNNIHCHFVRASRLQEAVMNREYDENDKLLESVYRNCPALVVDDLGHELEKCRNGNAVVDIIRSRLDDLKVTIVTTIIERQINIVYPEDFVARLKRSFHLITMPDLYDAKFITEF